MQKTSKLWRIVELLQTTTEFLQKKSIDNPRLNAELLLCKVLGSERVELYVNYDKPVSPDELQHYREYIRRRASHEPLQYILEKTEFMSLPFQVSPSVLIPRQDTETLVEWVLERFSGRKKVNILDLGTGSGNIAISLAHYLDEPKIMAVDVSLEALEIARNNAKLNKMSEYICFVHFDILDSKFDSQFNSKFDVIVSNPPYVAEHEFLQLEQEVREYEPRVALVAEDKNDIFFHRICDLGYELLKDDGELFVEVGAGQSKTVELILKKNQFKMIEIRNDYAGIERVVLASRASILKL